MNRVLIFEDSEIECRLISSLLYKAGFIPIIAQSFENGKEEIIRLPPGAVILTSMKFNGGSSVMLSDWLKSREFGFPVIVIIDSLNLMDLLQVMRNGRAIDAIQRLAINKQLVETIKRYAKPQKASLYLDNSLIPRRSNKFQQIEKAIDWISSTDANCIILGESGMGKKQIARQIYLRSPRRQKPIITLEAGGADLIKIQGLEPEHCEIYTRIKGYFKYSNGGTIIIKNIQLLSFEMQSVLLHILSEEHSDVRVICTANPSLLKMLSEDKFRDSLFFILRQASIVVPPLREMTEDISDIASYVLSRYAQNAGCLPKRLDASAIKALRLVPWPGNIRELKDTILFTAFNTKSNVITASDLILNEYQLSTAEDLSRNNPKTEIDKILKAYLRSGTWRGASKLLGISEKTLIQLRKKYGISPDGKIGS